MEIPESEVEPSEQIENSSEKVSFGVFVYFFGSNQNESDKYDTEDPPEPDIEKPENETEINEISENAETAAENSANVNKKNNKVTLLANEEIIKTANSQNGMTFSGFLSIILLSIVFVSLLIYTTQPKKINKNYSKFHGIKISTN